MGSNPNPVNVLQHLLAEFPHLSFPVVKLGQVTHPLCSVVTMVERAHVCKGLLVVRPVCNSEYWSHEKLPRDRRPLLCPFPFK